MSFQFEVVKNRTTDYQFTFYEDDETTGVVLAATDVVRFKMYRRDGATPTLDLDSAAATANGSSVTVDQLTTPAKATVRIAQGDTSSLEMGAYSAEALIVDDSLTSPTDGILHAESGVVFVVQSGGGDVGKS